MSHCQSIKQIEESINALVNELEDSSLHLSLDNDYTISEQPTNANTLFHIQKSIYDPIQLDSTELNSPILPLDTNKVVLLSNDNLGIQISKVNAQEYRSNLWKEISKVLPTGYFSHNLIYKDSSNSFFSTTTGTPVNSNENYVSQFGLRSNFSLQNAFGISAAADEFRSSQYNLRSNKLDAAYQALDLYNKLLLHQAQLIVRTRGYNQAKQHLLLNDALFQGGIGTKLAVYQSEEQLQQLKIDLTNQQLLTRSTELELLSYLNLPFINQIQCLENIYEQLNIIDINNTPVDTLIRQGLSSHPSLKQNKYQLAAEKKKIKQAWAKLTPTVYLSTSITGNQADIANSLEMNDFYNASAGVEWVFAEGLGLGQISTIKKQKSNAQEALYSYQQKSNDLEKLIRQSYIKLHSIDQEIQIIDKKLNSNKEGVQLALLRLKSGIGTNLDLINSHTNYINTLLQKTDALARYNQVQFQLTRVLGVSPLSNKFN